ncbi:hypothetical protein BJY01DRAFT_30410 [Aspergillus pseudoustus]|uniref:Uncharacterized protein n=1 Tax=Aspergillus pseudoustus TaxID=1810923 RepID=A0ABR4KQ75_9EURO
MAYRRESLSSTSTSSSSSSVSSFSSTARNRGASTQKFKLKRWLSSQLLTPRQPSNSTTTATTTTNTTATTTANTLLTTNNTNINNPTTTNDTKLSPTTSASKLQARKLKSSTSSSSSLGINKPHHHDGPNYNSHVPEYNPAAYYTNHRDERTIHLQTEYTSPNDPLSDSYAAYCRAFTSSPSPDRQQKRIPLPRLPTSTDTDGFEPIRETETETGAKTIIQEKRSPTELSHPHYSPSRDFERGPQFIIGSTIASAAEATPATASTSAAAAASAPPIRFLPVGAHGYQPASWALPRPPTPPPGILTPARYEEMQRRAEEEMEREMKDKKNWEGGLLTWCLPIRASWVPWGRPKEP